MRQEIIEVYADFIANSLPRMISELKYNPSNRGGVFSFSYSHDFLKSSYCLQIDPLLTLHQGEHYNDHVDKNFRLFLDSSPDR